MTINDIINEAHATAMAKGWYEDEPSIPSRIALMHSELSEALEAWRKDAEVLLYEVYYEGAKPEGMTVELADVIIRICDMAGRYGLPLDEAIQVKLAYNKSRPHRHGGKRA